MVPDWQTMAAAIQPPQKGATPPPQPLADRGAALGVAEDEQS